MTAARVSIFANLLLALLSFSGTLNAQDMPHPVPDTGSPPVQTVVLKDGTEVDLKFAQKVTAKAAVVNEPVELVVAADLKVGNSVVVRQGTRVLGAVTSGKETEKKRAEAKSLAIQVDLLRTGDHRIRLRGEKVAEGKRNKDAMIAGTIILGLSGLIATSGKHYVIPEGTPLTAYVDEDIELPVLQN